MCARYTWPADRPYACKRRLAHFDRLSAKVCAIQFQQVEGLQEGRAVVPAAAKSSMTATG
jgi:hypothetical protein